VSIHHVRRRLLIAGTGALLVAPTLGQAQGATKPFRIGLLQAEPSQTLIQESLRELGYVEGRDVVYEARYSERRSERLDNFDLELVRLKVDVIVAANPASVLSAKRATATIPVVMTNTPDPVQLGIVASLARPTGNVTGTTTLTHEISIKQLELLTQAVPRAPRVALLWNPDNPWHALTVRGLSLAAARSAFSFRLSPCAVQPLSTAPSTR